jgi:AcrR family transcriptional regulator
MRRLSSENRSIIEAGCESGKGRTGCEIRMEREKQVRVGETEAPGTTVATPWGEAAALKERRLHPGSGTPRMEVVRNQRERLFGAIVAVVSEKGYEATTVADVIELSGVSRSAFYEHFANKAECLAAAAAELIRPTLGALGEVEAEGGGGQAVFERFVDLLGTQRAAARVCFVELHAAGEMGEAVADRGFEALAQMVDRLGNSQPGGGPGPMLTRVLLDGLRKLIHTRLCRGEERDLATAAPELWRWLLSVAPPPRKLEAPRRQRTFMTARFEGYTPGERIARAVAAVVAEKGYLQTSTDDIAARASISLSTFYAHFADKRDAVLGALEMSGAQVMALAVPAARRAGGWQRGVRALYEAICAYFAAEPEMAELGMVGIYGAGPRALARRDRVIDALAEMLSPALEENPQVPRISAEIAAATVYALMRAQVIRDGPRSLPSVVPLATYVTLVGFVGPERACAVANGEAG